MRRVLLIGGLLIANVILQTVVWPVFPFWQSYPDFLLVVVVAFALMEGPLAAAVIGMCGGLLLDAFGGPMGLMGLAYLIMGAIVGLFYKRIYVDGIVVPALFVIGLSIPWQLLQVLILYLGGWEIHFGYFMTRHFLPSLLGTVAFSPFVYMWLAKLHRYKWLYRLRNDDGLF